MFNFRLHIFRLSLVVLLALSLNACDFVLEDNSTGLNYQGQELETSLWQNDFLVIIASQNAKLIDAVSLNSKRFSESEMRYVALNDVVTNCQQIQNLLEHIATIKNISIPNTSSTTVNQNYNSAEIWQWNSVQNLIDNQLSATQTLKKFTTSEMINEDLEQITLLIKSNEDITADFLGNYTLQTNLKNE